MISFEQQVNLKRGRRIGGRGEGILACRINTLKHVKVLFYKASLFTTKRGSQADIPPPPISYATPLRGLTTVIWSVKLKQVGCPLILTSVECVQTLLRIFGVWTTYVLDMQTVHSHFFGL